MREKDYNYEYPIQAIRLPSRDEMYLRKMRKDELPDDDTHTWYCRVDGSMFREGEDDFKIV